MSADFQRAKILRSEEHAETISSLISAISSQYILDPEVFLLLNELLTLPASGDSPLANISPFAILLCAIRMGRMDSAKDDCLTFFGQYVNSILYFPLEEPLFGLGELLGFQPLSEEDEDRFQELFTRANNLSKDASEKKIGTRHLLLEVLLKLKDGPLAGMLVERNLRIDEMLRAFLSFAKSRYPAEQDAWQRRLQESGLSHLLPRSEESRNPIPLPSAPRKARANGPAGYTSEFCGLGSRTITDDHLSVAHWAEQFGDLIALRETKLPLAIGLFGNWGTGKSHFMNLIDARLKFRAEESPSRSKIWCSNTVSVHFNAWHYLDDNLWASLVARIFEKLFQHFEGEDAEKNKIAQRLEAANGVMAKARTELDEATVLSANARREYLEAEKQTQGAKAALATALNGLRRAFTSDKTEKEWKDAVNRLGLDNDVNKVEQFVLEIQSTEANWAGALRLWKAIRAPEGRTKRYIYIGGWAFGAALTAFAVTEGLTTWKYLPPGWIPVLSAVGTGLAGIGTSLARLNKFLNSVTTQIDRVNRDAVSSANAAPSQQRVIAARKALETCEVNEEIARSRLQQATIEVEELRPERRLFRFLENRVRTSHYQNALGLVSLARKDFETLSDVFGDERNHFGAGKDH